MNEEWNYPDSIQLRRHGPEGYVDYQKYKPWLRDEFKFRCVYCLRREQWFPDSDAAMSVEHYVPQSVNSSLSCEYDNLLYACQRCNSYRGNRPNILDPCSEIYRKHIAVQPDGTIIGLTREGRAHILAIDLDDPSLTLWRRKHMSLLNYLKLQGDPEAEKLLDGQLGFPDDLPDLARKRPPGKNTKPQGIGDCYFNQRRLGRLPNRY